jgi:hypothetical protein
MSTALHRSPNKLWRSTVTPYLTYAWGHLRETRERWPFLTVKTEANALQRKSHLCSVFLFWELRRPIPISCVCERFIYSQNRSTNFLLQNRQIDFSNIKNRSLRHECGHWDCGRAVPFLGIFVLCGDSRSAYERGPSFVGSFVSLCW